MVQCFSILCYRYKNPDPVISIEEEAALESNDNLHISGDNEPPGLRITEATEADSGRYWCIAQTEGKPVKLLCFVYITGTCKINLLNYNRNDPSSTFCKAVVSDSINAIIMPS